MKTAIFLKVKQVIAVPTSPQTNFNLTEAGNQDDFVAEAEIFRHITGVELKSLLRCFVFCEKTKGENDV